jgi:hypothetical protein
MLALILLELTLVEVLSDLPHDTGALIVYALVAVSIALVWMGSRNRSGSVPTPPSGRAEG